MLTQAGYEHDEAANGIEALEKAEAADYDVVLLDYLMPKMDGMEVLSNLRKMSPRSKIIIMTAFATIDGRRGDKKRRKPLPSQNRSR